MPRALKTPTYRLHKSSGQAVVTLRDDVSRIRRDILLGPHNSPASHADYARVVAEWEAANRRLMARTAAPGDVTVNEVALAFLDHAETCYSTEGREAVQFKLALGPLCKVHGDTTAVHFGPEALKEVRQAMLDQRLYLVRHTAADGDASWEAWLPKAHVRPNAKNGPWEARRQGQWCDVDLASEKPALCRNVVNRRITRIKTMFKWAVAEERIPGGVYEALRAVRALPPNAQGVRHTAPVGPAFWHQVEAVLPHCAPPVAAMLQLQWLTGMRSGEVRKMRTLDLDRTDPACWLYRPGSDEGPHGAHKNAWRGQDRVVALGPKCIEVLAPWIRSEDPAAYLFDPRKAEAERNAKRRGDKPPRRAKKRRKARPRRTPLHDHYTAFSYPQAVRRACAKVGVAFHPYQLRHGRKMVVVRAAGSDAARAVLGQKSIDSTQHYGELDVQTAGDVMKAMG